MPRPRSSSRSPWPRAPRPSRRTSTAPAGAVGGRCHLHACGHRHLGPGRDHHRGRLRPRCARSPAGAVSYQTAGTCTLDFNQAGNANYNAAPQVQQSFTVGKGSQTITPTTTAPAGAVVAGAPYTPAATAPRASPWPSPSTPRRPRCARSPPASVSYQAVGTCVVDFNQAGNANYHAAPQVQQSFAVGKGSQTITPTSTNPGQPMWPAPPIPRPQRRRRAWPWPSPSTPRPPPCARSPPAWSATRPSGTCTVDFNQAGNANYLAAPQVQQAIAVGQGSQTVTPTSTHPRRPMWPVPPTPRPPSRPRAWPWPSPSTPARPRCVRSPPVSSATRPSAPARSTSTRPATPTTRPHPRSSRPSPSPRAPRRSRRRRPTRARPPWPGPPTRPTATASSGLAVAITIDASSSSVCAITAGAVSYQAVGTCMVDFNQAGNANYLAASQVQQSIAVGQGLPDHHADLDRPDRCGRGRAHLHA